MLYQEHPKKLKNTLAWIVFMNLLGLNLAKNVDEFNNFGRSVKESDSNSSLEPVIERLQSAAIILKNQKSDIKPCDNFYEFACGNYESWDKSNQKPKSTISETQSVINDQINNLIMSSNYAPHKSRPAELVGSLYHICMDERKIESRGLEPLQKVLKRLDNWPFLSQNSSKSTFDWVKVVTRSQRMGFSGNDLLDLKILSYWNQTELRLSISEPFLEFNRDTFLSAFAHKNFKAYYEYMVDIAVLLGSNRDNAERELLKVVNFERKLSRVSINEDEDEFDKRAKTLEDLIKIWPKIDWSRLINKTLQLYGESDRNVSVYVRNPFYISKLEKVLAKTPKKVIANYLAWKVIKSSAPFLNKEMQKLHEDYMSKTRNDFKSLPRSTTCINIVKSFLDLSVNYLYVKQHFRSDVKGNVMKMVNNIKDILMNVLNTVDWLDEDTKKYAIQKVQNMKSLIGYSEKMLNDEKVEEFYEGLDFNVDDNYFESVFNLGLFITRKNIEVGVISFNRMKKFYSPLIVNAYYFPKLNQIMIPTGILQNIFYNNNRPNYMNYGQVGSIIGHEVTHGLDNKGRKFDKHGNFTDWWSPYANNTYNKKTACFIKQYNNFTTHFKYKVNGKLTLNENIADIVGARIAYLAYRKWVSKYNEEPALPELHYTPNQLFWISFANSLCEIKADSNNLDTNNVHAPSNVRVTGTLSNIPEFAADFGCPTGSNMNPIQKCSIW